MNSIFNVFVVMHIRLHDVKFGKYRADVLLTVLLILLLLLSLWRLTSALGIDIIELEISYSQYFFRIFRSFIFLLFVTLFSFFWLSSWPKSYRAINEAGRRSGAGDGMQDATFGQDRMQDNPGKKDIETKKKEAKQYDSPFETTNKYYERLDTATNKFESNDGSYMTFDKEVQEKREAIRKKILKQKSDE